MRTYKPITQILVGQAAHNVMKQVRHSLTYWLAFRVPDKLLDL